MTLGAVIALAVIVLGATQLPRFLKTHAGSDQAAQVNSQVTPNPQALSASSPDARSNRVTGTPNSSPTGSPLRGTSPADGALHATNATAAVGGDLSANPATPLPSGHSPRSHRAQPVNNQTPQAQDKSSDQVAGSEQSITPSAPLGGEQTAVPKPASNPANAQELEELSDLHTKLAVRAQAANDSVENLRKQMAATGNNLRADISAAQARMKSYMDKFDAAMNTGDPAAAKKYMALAEREVENLEKFFGQ
jgi:hypothetical protein